MDRSQSQKGRLNAQKVPPLAWQARGRRFEYAMLHRHKLNSDLALLAGDYQRLTSKKSFAEHKARRGIQRSTSRRLI